MQKKIRKKHHCDTGEYKNHEERLNKSRPGYFKNTSGEIPSFSSPFERLLVLLSCTFKFSEESVISNSERKKPGVEVTTPEVVCYPSGW